MTALRNVSQSLASSLLSRENRFCTSTEYCDSIELNELNGNVKSCPDNKIAAAIVHNSIVQRLCILGRYGAIEIVLLLLLLYVADPALGDDNLARD